MVSEFSEISYEAGKRGDAFPLDAVKSKVRNRPVELHEQNFLWQPWFSLKVLTPTRTYLFSGAKPQVDHIFPIRLDGGELDVQRESRHSVDVTAYTRRGEQLQEIAAPAHIFHQR